MFYSITFAPAFERERRFRNDGNVEVSLGRYKNTLPRPAPQEAKWPLS